jgi:hypothetical protein
MKTTNIDLGLPLYVTLFLTSPIPGIECTTRVHGYAEKSRLDRAERLRACQLLGVSYESCFTTGELIRDLKAIAAGLPS